MVVFREAYVRGSTRLETHVRSLNATRRTLVRPRGWAHAAPQIGFLRLTGCLEFLQSSQIPHPVLWTNRKWMRGIEYRTLFGKKQTKVERKLLSFVNLFAAHASR